MRRAVLVLLAVNVAVRAQLPGVPHGGGTCSDDWDCSLGGECVANVCKCDPHFTGLDCHYLNLQPAKSFEAQGLQDGSYFSWGGHSLRDTEGTYHLFASLMCDHATLNSWTTKSSMAHATSSSPIGPYVLPSGQDAQLIVPPWSHGAYIVQDPPTKEYLLFHLGNGAVDKASWSPCYDSASAALPGAAVPGGDSNAYVRSGGDGGAFIHTAPSLDGPWTPWRNSTSVDVSFPPGSWTSSIDNPAPYIFENGTTLLFFRSETCPEGWGNLAPACIGVARAPTWQGPYESLFLNPITHPEGEDPSVWRDARNNFHMLTNINTVRRGRVFYQQGGSGSRGRFPVMLLNNPTRLTTQSRPRPPCSTTHVVALACLVVDTRGLATALHGVTRASRLGLSFVSPTAARSRALTLSARRCCRTLMARQQYFSLALAATRTLTATIGLRRSARQR